MEFEDKKVVLDLFNSESYFNYLILVIRARFHNKIIAMSGIVMGQLSN